jgi:Holliday junction resolvase
MSLLRRNPRRDQSEPAIVQALEQTGWSVCQVSVKDGPDLFAAKGGIVVTIECKTGSAKLKPGQVDFQQRWNAPVYVLRTLKDVEDLNWACGKPVRR